MKIYDVSVPLCNELPVYPGDPPVVVEPFLRLARGEGANVSRLSISTHAGTHFDAPRHMDDRGVPVDRLPLSLLMGRALVVEIAARGEIGREELERLPIKGEDRLLLKTGNSLLWGSQGFRADYASLGEDGADYLIGIGVGLVGIDYLSIEAHGKGSVHDRLLGHGVVILEGLNLTGVPSGVYELVSLPLRVKDGDGAPARVILRREEDGARHGEVDLHTTRWPLA